MNDDIVPPRPKKQTTPLQKPEETIEAPKTAQSVPVRSDIRVSIPSISTKQPSKKRRSPLRWFKDLSKPKKALFISIIMAVIAGGTFAAYTLLQSEPAPQPTPIVTKKEEPPKPTTVASRLTGLQVKPELNDRPPIGIMIENSPDARPQASLNQAGVVFEAIAEGGITRFLALYQEAQPDYIGPVRSVRPYYLDWLQGFDAAVVHAGGSGDGLAKIRSDGIKDLDFGANGNAFTRVNNRYAPHNLYTSMARLDEIAKKRGYTTSSFTSFARKEEKKTTAPTAATIDFDISSPLYDVQYVYDTATNTYKRNLGGKPHADERSKEQIAPKVVVALVMKFSQRGIYSVYNSIGEGKAYIFQDGNVTIGNWKKIDKKNQIEFTDANGTAVKLNPGQTWISAVKTEGSVTYKP